MRVVVTGGTGFTGAALSLRLASEGHEVVALGRRQGLRGAELAAAGVRVVLGSVTDRDTLDSVVPGADVIFHLAAAFRQLGVPDGYYREVNVEGTRGVAECALRHGVPKLVHCSTMGVHGSVAVPPADEEAPFQPRDYYQQSKLEGELALAPFPDRGLPVTVIRPAAIYGPGDPGHLLLLFRRVASGFFPMFGDGRTLYHTVYIDNLLDGFLAAAAEGSGDGRAYLIADPTYVTLDELVRGVAAALDVRVRVLHLPLAPLLLAGELCDRLLRPLGIPPPLSPRRVDWFRSNRAFRTDRARRELGWEPRLELGEGLRRTAEWYRANGYLRR
jgi:nucleoside-diphosphate-sugar epimerase